MADNQVNASPETIRELVQNIKSIISKILEELDKCGGAVKNLQATFQDDGYDIVKNGIEANKKIITEQTSNLEQVYKSLEAYASKLENSRAALGRRK